MTSCGLWLKRRRLVAVLAGPGGEARRTIRAALTDDARFGLVEYLAQADVEIVATEALACTTLAIRGGSPAPSPVTTASIVSRKTSIDSTKRGGIAPLLQ